MGLADSWQDWVSAGWANSQKVTGPMDEADCPSAVWARGLGDITIADGLAQVLTQDKAWVYLLFSCFRDFVDEDVRLEYCRLAATYPIIAANVYVQVPTAWALDSYPCPQPGLDDDERVILLQSFHSSWRADGVQVVPVAEAQIDAMVASGALPPYPVA